MKNFILSVAALSLIIMPSAQASTIDDLKTTLKEIAINQAAQSAKLHEVFQGLSDADILKLNETLLEVDGDETYTAMDGLAGVDDLLNLGVDASTITLHSVMDGKKVQPQKMNK